MMAQAVALREASSTTRQARSVYGTVGLRADPFPPAPEAGPYVSLDHQVTVLSTIRDWLRSLAADAPGIAVVTGAEGTGKTRLLEQLVLAIADDDRLIGVVPGDGSRRTDAHLLRATIGALGGTPLGRTGLELTNELRTLLDAQRDNPLAPVLLIDDAALTGSQLEILRGVLTRPEPGASPTRAQIVLFGPPALPDRIARRRSLASLVRHVAPLPPLDEARAKTLLEGRVTAMRDAPMGQPFFDDGAVAMLLGAAGGNARRLLELAHAAVREAIATGRPDVDAATAQAVVDGVHHGGAVTQTGARETPVIQTRLLLPEVDPGQATPAGVRRRGRQR